MRKKQLLLLQLLLSASALCYGQVRVSPNNFVSAVSDANDGDTLLLDSGTYSEAIEFPKGKTLTIQSSPDASSVPLLTFQIKNHEQSNGYLRFRSVEIDRNGDDYFFTTSSSTPISGIEFEDCRIHNIRKSLIETNSEESSIGYVKLSNCTIYDCGASKTSLISSSMPIDKVDICNSTIYNYVGGNIFEGKRKNANSSIEFSFINNTVYKSIWNDTYSICSPSYAYDGNSVYKFENNILYKSAADGQPRIIYVRTGGSVIETNNIKIGYAGNYRTGGGSETVNNHTLGSGLFEGINDVPFKNPEQGDFSIPATSSFASAGTNGSCIGAPSWIVVVEQPVNITTSVSPANAGISSPSAITIGKGEPVRLTAEPNFGYRFAYWSDSNGNTLSSEPVFTYNIENDSHITANFTKIATYSLGIDITGGGKDYMVEVSPSGVLSDGKLMYEEGTEVSVIASDNSIIKFMNWENDASGLSRNIIMNQDHNICANYVSDEYVVGWDFFLKGNSARIPDFYSTIDNSTSQLVVRNQEGDILGWLDKSIEAADGLYGHGGAVIWKQLDEKHYFQTKINASDFRDIVVSSQMLYSYNAYKIQQLQWSLDGENWNLAGSVSFNGAKQWVNLDARLPEECNNKNELYLRWIPLFESGAAETAQDASSLNGAALGEIYITATTEIFNDGLTPVITSVNPADNAVNISSSGKIIINFDKKIQVDADAVATIGNLEFKIQTTAKTLWINYNGLDYNKEYTFCIAPGMISDISGNTLNTPVSVTFRTMERPAVNPKLFDYVVKAGDATDLISAINTANSMPGLSRYRIFVPAGLYDLGATTYTTIKRSNISLIGEGIDKTIIQNKPSTSGIGVTATLFITDKIENTYIQGITLRNAWPYLVEDGGDGGGVAVAFQDSGDKTILKNVSLKSFQDTYFSSSDNLRSYFEDCSISGTVDFICGNGNVFFNRLLIYLEKRDGCVIVAPRGNAKWGYVFNDCTISGLPTNNGTYRLGRPWGNMSKTVYINTTMELLPTAEGWGDMGGNVPEIFAEYNSLTAEGLNVDCSMRKKYYNVNNEQVLYQGPSVLTREQASEYTSRNVVGGDDLWMPELLTEQATTPGISVSGNTISWNNDGFSICYLIFRDGELLTQTTADHLDIDSEGVYVVCAANEMGGISNASNALDIRSLSISETSAAGSEQIVDVYSIEGILLIKQSTLSHAKATLPNGIYIAGDRKLIINK